MEANDLRYFKQNPGYERILGGILARYRSLGRLGGSVRLEDLTEAEKKVLSSHLRRDLSKQDEVKFTVGEFAKSLKITRFASYTLAEILSAYFDVELLSAKEAEDRFLKERREFFSDLVAETEQGLAREWLEAVCEERATGITRLWQRYGDDQGSLEEDMLVVARALEILESRQVPYWRLPVFASLVTSDPHAFDHNTALGKMLFDALATAFGVEIYTSREEISELLYGAGLLVDELSNSVTCAGLLAYQGLEVHPVWAGALESREPLQMPLSNLVKLNKVKSPGGLVFVVENPGVMGALLDAFADEALPPLICTAGQVRIAGLVLLDLLAKEETTIYYSGDLDPEGLLIAQRLAKRYPENFRYWRFTALDYEEALSHIKLGHSRLAKLNGITDRYLQGLCKVLGTTKFAAYQELLLPGLIEDVKALSNRWNVGQIEVSHGQTSQKAIHYRRKNGGTATTLF